MKSIRLIVVSLFALALPALAQQPAHKTFLGYSCIDVCKGHKAGYLWAEQNGIADEDDCTGNSESFLEGCFAYVAQQALFPPYSDDDVADALGD